MQKVGIVYRISHMEILNKNGQILYQTMRFREIYTFPVLTQNPDLRPFTILATICSRAIIIVCQLRSKWI